MPPRWAAGRSCCATARRPVSPVRPAPSRRRRSRPAAFVGGDAEPFQVALELPQGVAPLVASPQVGVPAEQVGPGEAVAVFAAGGMAGEVGADLPPRLE